MQAQPLHRDACLTRDSDISLVAAAKLDSTSADKNRLEKLTRTEYNTSHTSHCHLHKASIKQTSLRHPQLPSKKSTISYQTALVDAIFGPLWAHYNHRAMENYMVGTLAVDEWDVKFGTARRGLGGLWLRPVPSSLYQM